MKKFIFIVQGEGRGHLTQAIALSEMLHKAGHEVVATLLGIADEKPIPKFFREQMDSPIISFQSPSLTYHPKTKALCIYRTIKNGIFKLPTYLKSISKIKKTIAQFNPDVIINFYDVLGGIHQFSSKYLWFNQKPMICIAHQYLLLHKDFIYPKNHQWIDRFLVNLNTQLTSLAASKCLALSFKKMENDKGIIVVPPLLRNEVWKLKYSQNEEKDYILAYMTQPSMERELINWHYKNMGVEVHCFSDRQQIPETLRHSSKLYFHKINGTKFLEMMAECRAVVSTAGFESICEAMLLNKPTMMIPLPKHFEQNCNSVDAELAGAGIINDKFDLNPLVSYLNQIQSDNSQTTQWFAQADRKFIAELTGNQAVKNEERIENYSVYGGNIQPV
jgi:uncharacterized protein (TIGR00661 family)